jgi:hypothetical protein
VFVASQPDQRFDMSIREWQQIKRRVRRVPRQSAWIENLGFVAIGLPIPTVIAFLIWIAPYEALKSEDQLRYAFVAPALVAVAIGSLVVGAILLLVSYQRRHDEQNDIDDIVTEMETIEARLGGPPK